MKKYQSKFEEFYDERAIISDDDFIEDDVDDYVGLDQYGDEFVDLQLDSGYEDEDEDFDYYEDYKSGKLSFKEAESVAGTIGTVIDTNWSGDNSEQLKAVQMLKFLATSDDPLSNKFMKALDKATSALKKEDFK